MSRSGMKNAAAKAWAWLSTTGSGAVVLIGGENHEPVGEGQREGVTSAVPSGSRCRGHPDQGHRVAGRIGAGRPVRPVRPYDLRLVTHGLRVRCNKCSILPVYDGEYRTLLVHAPPSVIECRRVPGADGQYRGRRANTEHTTRSSAVGLRRSWAGAGHLHDRKLEPGQPDHPSPVRGRPDDARGLVTASHADLLAH